MRAGDANLKTTLLKVEINFNTRRASLFCRDGLKVNINIISAGLFIFACNDSSTPASDACNVDFSGNLDASMTVASCASVARSDGGDALLVVDSTTAAFGRLHVSIDLGVAPTTGSVSSDTVNDWSAMVLGFGDANCAFTAGSADVPFGSFVLTLDSLSDAGTPSLHGDLTLVMYVHQPPTVSCGATDIENVHVRF